MSHKAKYNSKYFLQSADLDVINTGHSPTPLSQGVLSAHDKKQSVMSNYFHICAEGDVHLRIWLAETNLKVRAAITSETLVSK